MKKKVLICLATFIGILTVLNVITYLLEDKIEDDFNDFDNFLTDDDFVDEE